MRFIGIDLHTNKFTCCYRDEDSRDAQQGKQTKTFLLNSQGIEQFWQTLTTDTIVLVEATITTFSFVRLFQPLVQEVIVANTYNLKPISEARKNTDKIDADILCQMLIMYVHSRTVTSASHSKVEVITPVTVPPEDIQDLRSLFSTYRLLKKECTQTKNRIHSLLKERLYGFTQEQIFGQRNREMIRTMESGTAMAYQVNMLLDTLEFVEAKIEQLKEEILMCAETHMREIEILTSIKGISVFIAAAIIADIINVDRFKNSKAFTSYLRSAPRVSNSNTSVSIRGTNKKGRKVSSTLITQSLHHVRDFSDKLNHWYTRLSEYKKPGLVLSGLRRRVFAEIYQMLKKDEYHYDRDAKNHEAKLAQYRKFLEKRKIFAKTA